VNLQRFSAGIGLFAANPGSTRERGILDEEPFRRDYYQRYGSSSVYQSQG
jgi:hypothetical protein